MHRAHNAKNSNSLNGLSAKYYTYFGNVALCLCSLAQKGSADWNDRTLSGQLDRNCIDGDIFVEYAIGISYGNMKTHKRCHSMQFFTLFNLARLRSYIGKNPFTEILNVKMLQMIKKYTLFTGHAYSSARSFAACANNRTSLPCRRGSLRQKRRLK